MERTKENGQEKNQNYNFTHSNYAPPPLRKHHTNASSITEKKNNKLHTTTLGFPPGIYF